MIDAPVEDNEYLDRVEGIEDAIRRLRADLGELKNDTIEQEIIELKNEIILLKNQQTKVEPNLSVFSVFQK